MKKWLVVAYNGYYPDCGLHNIRHHTDSWEEAYQVNEFLKNEFDSSEIVDSESFEPEAGIAMDNYYISLAKEDGWYTQEYYVSYIREGIVCTRDQLITKYTT